jgi:hypothetical protein
LHLCVAFDKQDHDRISIGAGIKHIRELECLRELYVDNFPTATIEGAQGDILAIVQNCEQLSVLGFRRMTAIDDELLSNIVDIFHHRGISEACNVLESLDISGCREVTGDGLLAVSALTTLKRLNLCNLGVSVGLFGDSLVALFHCCQLSIVPPSPQPRHSGLSAGLYTDCDGSTCCPPPELRSLAYRHYLEYFSTRHAISAKVACEDFSGKVDAPLVLLAMQHLVTTGTRFHGRSITVEVPADDIRRIPLIFDRLGRGSLDGLYFEFQEPLYGAADGNTTHEPSELCRLGALLISINGIDLPAITSKAAFSEYVSEKSPNWQGLKLCFYRRSVFEFLLDCGYASVMARTPSDMIVDHLADFGLSMFIELQHKVSQEAIGLLGQLDVLENGEAAPVVQIFFKAVHAVLRIADFQETQIDDGSLRVEDISDYKRMRDDGFAFFFTISDLAQRALVAIKAHALQLLNGSDESVLRHDEQFCDKQNQSAFLFWNLYAAFRVCSHMLLLEQHDSTQTANQQNVSARLIDLGIHRVVQELFEWLQRTVVASAGPTLLFGTMQAKVCIRQGFEVWRALLPVLRTVPGCEAGFTAVLRFAHTVNCTKYLAYQYDRSDKYPTLDSRSYCFAAVVPGDATASGNAYDQGPCDLWDRLEPVLDLILQPSNPSRYCEVSWKMIFLQQLPAILPGLIQSVLWSALALIRPGSWIVDNLQYCFQTPTFFLLSNGGLVQAGHKWDPKNTDDFRASLGKLASYVTLSSAYRAARAHFDRHAAVIQTLNSHLMDCPEENLTALHLQVRSVMKMAEALPQYIMDAHIHANCVQLHEFGSQRLHARTGALGAMGRAWGTGQPLVQAVDDLVVECPGRRRLLPVACLVDGETQSRLNVTQHLESQRNRRIKQHYL